MSAAPAVEAVVVNYQGQRTLRDCVSSLLAATGDLEGGAEVTVVDNASTDGSAELVRDHFEDVRLISLPRNLGFGGGVNQALHESEARWLLLVNNDATVEPTTVSELLAVGEPDQRVGSVAAQIRFVSRPDLINSAGITVDGLGVAADRLLGRSLSASETGPVEVFGVSGGGAIYRRAMLEELGGFDERFFVFLEDVDVAWRARMKGWRAMYAPAAVVHHHHSATARHGSAFKHFHVGRNRVRLIAKNASSRQLRRYGAGMVAYDLAQTLFVAVTARSLAPLRGRIAGLRQWPAARRQGAEGRRPVDLAPVTGLRAALHRNRAWALGSASAAEQ